MTTERHLPKSRVAGILKLLNAGMHEREEIMAVCLLAALAGQNAFLLGPPGTAKSLIARRISRAFSERAYFGYLMQRFSTPEEIFGPVSIKALKEDKYVRKTEGFLPEADFAFLDEIWKAGPAILNSLLTIINEKVFRNGVSEDEDGEKVPLKALIAASNEPPAQGQGLEALYDRFIVRLYVPPMQNNDNFVSLLQSPPAHPDVEVPADLAVGNAEWDEWQKGIRAVAVSEDTIAVVQLIRREFAKNKKLKAYISDRRWQKAMLIVKAAAFFCGRDKTNLADTLLLRHCLWDTDDNRDDIIKIVEGAVKDSGFSTEQDFGARFSRRERLEADIRSALFHDMDIYETETNANGTKCYVATVLRSDYYGSNIRETIDIYIPVSEADKKRAFHPLNKGGGEVRTLECQYTGQYAVDIKSTERHHSVCLKGGKTWKESIRWCPQVRFKKGDQRTFDAPETRRRLTASFRASVEECKNDLCAAKSDVEERLKAFEGELDSPFVPAEKRGIAVAGVRAQLDNIEAAIKDCEHLNELASD